jgi:hypothetical protein
MKPKMSPMKAVLTILAIDLALIFAVALIIHWSVS